MDVALKWLSGTKKHVVIIPKEPPSVRIRIPYKKLEMLRVLQKEYPYEVKGTIYFDPNMKFKSFEIRTDLDPGSAEGSEDWTLFFHTHPKQTAKNLGLPYFSPPSVEDVMEIYERTLRADWPDTHRLGETSIIIASEGLWILQVNRRGFRKMVREIFGEGAKPDEEVLEVILKETWNDSIAEILREINPGGKYTHKAPEKVFNELARRLSDQYGINILYRSWKSLQDRSELNITTNVANIKLIQK